MNTLIRKLYYSLPVNLRYAARRILYLPQDLLRDKKTLVPPKGKIFTGRGNFSETGKFFLERFKKYGNITPKSHVLDIGSGIGRMAVPFTGFLDKDGVYEGFDIVKMGVDWCTDNITKQYPNFRFKHIPLKNDLYNLSTDLQASKMVFPYEDDSFDFVFLTSVFTHMLPEDVENYIKEIKRVLKPGKICFAQFFILDNGSRESMLKKGSKTFNYDYGNYALMDKNVKEANVAYDKDYIINFIKDADLKIEHFMRGFWSGLEPHPINEHQDIIIFMKK
ncbi:class I SAM-dependent methyltransferase [Flavobacterium rhizosphaerae]|uniref:Class I SAM-dependent methyltransferase n=1 Tax=Flavobacterium rhizosphaerae TaxID=3163298 RepID=A0ABW8YW83_9FLAO